MASYVGFDKLKGELAQRPGVKSPGALAAFIGRRKFSKKKFDRYAAQEGRAGAAPGDRQEPRTSPAFIAFEEALRRRREVSRKP
jgi:hypothetical protein